MLHLRWTSIHVHKLASSIEISGAGMRGKVIHVSVGLDMLGSFRAKDSRFTSDGAFAVLLAKDSFICDAGCKPGILVLLLCVAAKTGYMVLTGNIFRGWVCDSKGHWTIQRRPNPNMSP